MDEGPRETKKDEIATLDESGAEEFWQQVLNSNPLFTTLDKEAKNRMAALDRHIKDGRKLLDENKDPYYKGIITLGISMDENKKEMIEQDTILLITVFAIASSIIREMRGKATKNARQVARQAAIETINAMIKRAKARQKTEVKSTTEALELLWADQRKRGLLI